MITIDTRSRARTAAKINLSFAKLMLALLILTTGVVAKAQSPSAPSTTPRTGYAAKKPVLAGACKICPWGAIADIVKTAMQPYGYDVQVCYNCAGSSEEARFVAYSKTPPVLTDQLVSRMKAIGVSPEQIPPPPQGSVDFGVTSTNFLWWAYQGTHDFVKDGPQKHLRLLALVQAPMYLIVAAKADLGITDLSQIKDKRWPVRILWDDGLLSHATGTILNYYGLSKESIESAGGHVASGISREDRKNFDIIIYQGTLSNAPEWDVWYEVSQQYNLTFLTLPDPLLAKLSKEFDMERKPIPDGLLRGINQPIQTVVYTGHAIYGREDMPDSFAYAVARAMDEHQDLLPYSYENYSYNPHTVWKVYGVPLHPGAARYYREKGYMK